ncbi:hypothetical protein Stsp02_51520 [Streptomyces sp. NBRC 14336]|uniref:GNAT family N-acetyltransferase n=1 Tax=Streptomyces sp. NBRC 14336 TaxID=3030992 RepID=UPI0024A3001D|nr:hypothetical protein Stsp02_51520 [Streptomyces sp. NBRC 14336]
MRTADSGLWLEHFCLSPDLQGQGQGLGSAVLRTLPKRADADDVPVRLNVLRGSPAQRLYERHGFTVEDQDPIDAFMLRRPGARFLPHVKRIADVRGEGGWE